MAMTAFFVLGRQLARGRLIGHGGRILPGRGAILNSKSKRLLQGRQLRRKEGSKEHQEESTGAGTGLESSPRSR